ncbi:prolactin 2 [Thalassophryne amazonica]|uniref:prolactin 2 n=1 Tax=Thalassophryne amazonica TaxID=390379 RepID=UPI0014717312|nr:prolactin 2 [Thalassophryne amazonica]
MSASLSSSFVPPPSLSPVCVSLVCLLLGGAGAAPACTDERAGCHFLSLADLFDRVIQHSARMHGISSDLHSELEQYFLSSKNQIGRVSRNCHTSAILTPNGKENAQRMTREELAEVVLKLLLAWRDPVWHFQHRVSQDRDFHSFSSTKARELSDMVRELHKGVQKVAEKMQMLGIISNSISTLTSPEARLASEWRLMKNYELLYCFRRDSNKVQNYLKILKCGLVPEHGC